MAMEENRKKQLIESLLTRGMENIIPGKEKLLELLSSGKVLNVYMGIDPTATRIHLGHAFGLRKLQIMANLGHQVTFLIGDFTAKIGDTSDKETERPILTDEEIKKVEGLVNWAVSKKFEVNMKEMPYEDAVKFEALYFFKEKYPPVVKVYSVGDFNADPPEIFSREFCGGPHVKNTVDIGHFKILKQESVGAGLRRIRAMVEP